MEETPPAAIPGPINTPGQVLFASLIGTTIEFFDFYLYATAAVLVFPRLIFPPSDPASATLVSLATFGVAFVARPLEAVLFGHFGDRVGRKTALVLALLCMGCSPFSSVRCPGVVLTPGLLTRRQALPFVGRPLRLPPGNHGNRSARPTNGSNPPFIPICPGTGP